MAPGAGLGSPGIQETRAQCPVVGGLGTGGYRESQRPTPQGLSGGESSSRTPLHTEALSWQLMHGLNNVFSLITRQCVFPSQPCMSPPQEPHPPHPSALHVSDFSTSRDVLRTGIGSVVPFQEAGGKYKLQAGNPAGSEGRTEPSKGQELARATAEARFLGGVALCRPACTELEAKAPRAVPEARDSAGHKRAAGTAEWTVQSPRSLLLGRGGSLSTPCSNGSQTELRFRDFCSGVTQSVRPGHLHLPEAVAPSIPSGQLRSPACSWA